MKNKIFSHNLLRILCVILLAALLAQKWAFPASASVVEGGVIGWGDNTFDQATAPSGLSDVIAMALGGYHSLALKSDGTVTGWGDNTFGQVNIPSGLSDVIAIDTFVRHSLALKGDGTVVGWGDDSQGQIDIPSGLTNVIAIDAGGYFNLALKSDHTVVGWGDNSMGQMDIPSGLTDVIAISAGGYHSLALKSDHTVVGWGDNSEGQTDIPSGLTNVTAISTGAYHSLALKSDGTVVAWGRNLEGETDIPAGLTGVVAISAGWYHNLALKNDGTVVAWGSNFVGAINIPAGLKGVAAIAAGGYHNLVLIQNPVANPGGPYLSPLGTSTAFDGSGSFDPAGNLLTYTCTFGDGGTGLGNQPSHTFIEAGVYNVCLTVNDSWLDSNPACTIAVVYDPQAGFVTGSGSIDSPAGAYVLEPGLSGRAAFGFVSKYMKGATVPTGNTAFKFQAGSFNFSSTSYDWLVVNQNGANAQFKGSGTVNAALDPNGNPYKFMLWAGDGSSTKSADTFRIRIWWNGTDGSENVVYDNGTNQAISAGNIVVHTGK